MESSSSTSRELSSFPSSAAHCKKYDRRSSYPCFRIRAAGSLTRRVSKIVRTVSGDTLQGLPPTTSILVIQILP